MDNAKNTPLYMQIDFTVERLERAISELEQKLKWIHEGAPLGGTEPPFNPVLPVVPVKILRVLPERLGLIADRVNQISDRVVSIVE